MVRCPMRLWIFLFFYVGASLFSEEVKLSSEVDPYAIANAPIQVTVSVVHSKKEHIDEKSFLLEKQPLKVEFVKEVQFSPTSDTVLSLYQFSLPAQKPGFYTLPEVTAQVDGRPYSSFATTYSIADPQAAPAPKPPPPKHYTAPVNQKAGDRIPIILKLESIVQGDHTLFPGQSVTVGYRFLFNFDVDLNKEELPLLEGKGLEKVGAKETKFYVKDQLNVLEVKQTLRAVKPGTYKFPAGAIQGRAYRMIGERKEQAAEDSKAASKPVTFQVQAFPEEGKPPSFNGAIGSDLNFTMQLLSKAEVNVGDKIDLVLEIQGKGQLFEMPMPEICCQPGFSGFFKVSDLPPLEKLSGDSKTFKVEIRPLSRSIEQIPPLEFSYFDPTAKTYQIKKSAPIPLKVRPIRKEGAEEGSPGQRAESSSSQEPQRFSTEPIEVGANELLSREDLKDFYFGGWWTLLILPLMAGLFFLQLQWKNFLYRQRQKPKVESSKRLFEDALKQPLESSEFFNGVQKALLRRLVERGVISSDNIAPEALSTEGKSGQVRAMIHLMEQQRFSGGEVTIDDDFLGKLKRLFEELACDDSP